MELKVDRVGKRIMPAEFAEQMKELAAIPDVEDGHDKADKLMCKVLKEAGYGEGVSVSRKMKKWYS